MTTEEINRLFEAGELPHDFINIVTEQARKAALKGGKEGRKMKKLYKRFMGEMGPHAHLFIEDPIQATHMRITESLRAVSTKSAVDQIVRLTGREIHEVEDLLPGEKLFFLSPKGMDTILGPEWRVNKGEAVAKAYDTFLKKHVVEGDAGLRSLFIKTDGTDLALAFDNDIPILALPGETVEHIGRYFKFKGDTEAWRSVIDKFDYVTNMFKGWTLAPFPAYHSRNAVSNLVQMALGGTLGIDNLRDSFRFMKGSNLLKPWGSKAGRVSEDLRSLHITTVNGDVISGEDLFNYAHQHGVFGAFLETEFKKPLAKRAPKTPAGLVAQEAKKFFTHEGIPVRMGFAAGAKVENFHRMAHFIGELRKGKTPWEAAMSVKKYFFNYNELTNFERSVMRRVFPFYTWSRKNIPLQLEALITQPGKYGQLGRVVEAMQSPEVKNMDRKQLPKWVHEQFGVPTRINRKTGDLEVSILRSWLPMADLMSVVHSNPVHAAVRHGFTLMHPLPKAGLERYMNESFFTESPLEEIPGEPTMFLGAPMSKRIRHLLKQSRVLSEIDRLAFTEGKEGELANMTRLLNAMGIVPKARGFDPEQMEKRYKFDVNVRKAQLKKKYNRAKKTGDKELIDYWRNLLEDAGGQA
jgi:hypothetical protein